ncbi:hypothetical protein [Streptomyces sp. TRM64462]|uniref:hypothetical protein n=1 Tax=Streptomyces sp. TRM64462 TaxID=2741726 RepID=UPI0020C75D46|nr:hypothetical protein [Streptomyces sp. TRM64462]
MAVWSARKAKRPADEPAPRGVALPVAAAADPSVPPTTGWLVRGKDGRLTAYAPVSGGVLRWTETRVGGPEWSGPVHIPAPGVLPYLSIAQGADGYVHLVGLRRTSTATEVVYALQYQSGLAVRDWVPVGSPYADRPDLAAQIGLPSAVVDSTGSLHVFVRNAGGGISGRAQVASGKWNRWADLKGSGVLGAISASVTAEGLMEVVAVTEDRLLRWEQTEVGVKFVRAADLETRAEPSSLCAEQTAPGRLTHFWLDAQDGTVRAWRPSSAAAAAASAAGGPGAVGGGGGTGPVAALRTPVDGRDCTVLARRDAATGRPALAVYATEEESAAAEWAVTGERCVGAPALALDGRGRVVLAVFGADGTLRVARQRSGPGLALEAWARV